MNKKSVIFFTWLTFAVLMLFSISAIELSVYSQYLPMHPRTPYNEALGNAWATATVITCCFGIFTFFFQEKFSEKKLFRLFLFAHSAWISIALCLFLSVKPIPSHRLHTVGDQSYNVPTEYLVRRFDSENALRLDMCLDSSSDRYLKGVYNMSKLPHCQSEMVILSARPSFVFSASDVFSEFFSKEGQSNSRDSLILIDETPMLNHISDEEGLSWYSRDHPEDLAIPMNSKETYLPINAQKAFVRFVHCEQGRCTHAVSTPQGIVNYDLKEPLDFNPKRWQVLEDDIVALISSWKI